jgi:hypothetical protein
VTAKKEKGGLTDKQEAACQAYIECGGNQSEAYRRAYDCSNSKPETVWVNSCKLFSDANVMQRVIELQDIHKERHNVTIDTLTTDLMAARDLAAGEKQPAAMTGAVMGIAKIHGLVTDKKDLTSGGSPIKNEWHLHPVTTSKNAE